MLEIVNQIDLLVKERIKLNEELQLQRRRGQFLLVSPADLLITAGVVGIGSVMSGLMGFGFALVTVPLLLMVLPPSTVVALVLTLACLSNALVALEARSAVRLSAAVGLVPWTLAGLYAGARLLQQVDPRVIQLLAGSVVVALAVALAGKVTKESTKHSGTGRTKRWTYALAGLTSGTLATSTGLGGPPVVLLMSNQSLEKDVFRGTLATYFVFTGLAGLVMLLLERNVAPGQLALFLILLPAVGLGKLLGSRLSRLFSDRHFRGLALAIISLTGLASVAKAVVGLIRQ